MLLFSINAGQKDSSFAAFYTSPSSKLIILKLTHYFLVWLKWVSDKAVSMFFR